MSLRTRIALAAGIAVAVAVVGIAVAAYLAVRSELRGEVDDSISARAEILERRVPDGPLPGAGGPGPTPRPPTRRSTTSAVLVSELSTSPRSSERTAR